MVVRIVRLCFLALLFSLLLITNPLQRLRFRHAKQSSADFSFNYATTSPALGSIATSSSTAATDSPPTTPSGNIDGSPSDLTTSDFAPIAIPRSQYAYVFYATDNLYACSALVNVHRLRTQRTRHHIHLLTSDGVDERYLKAFADLNVTVNQFEAPPLPPGSAGGYYDGCLLKLLAFRMQKIDPSIRRVIVLDADQLILRSLDSLFELPSVDLAAPRAYWINKDAFASTLMVIEPSERLWKLVSDGMRHMKGGEYDMDLVNQLFDKTVLMLPGSYVTLNSHWQDWNMPDWYRPEVEIQGGSSGLEQHSAELRALRKALNEIAGRRDQDQELLPLLPGMSAILHEKRRVPDMLKEAGVEVPPSESPDPGPSLPAQMPEYEQAPESENEPATASTSESSPIGESGEWAAAGGPGHEVAKEEKILAAQYAGQSGEVPLVKEAPTVDRHVLKEPLYQLYRSAHVLHFTALGKPWTWNAKLMENVYPDTHPLLGEQFRDWRQEALRVCPLERFSNEMPRPE